MYGTTKIIRSINMINRLPIEDKIEILTKHGYEVREEEYEYEIDYHHCVSKHSMIVYNVYKDGKLVNEFPFEHLGKDVLLNNVLQEIYLNKIKELLMYEGK